MLDPGGTSGADEEPESPFAGSDDDVQYVQGGRIGEVDARVGDLSFHPEFSDPDVDVTHTRETSDHEVVTGHDAFRNRDIEFAVQALGRRPIELTITGWVSEDQLDTVDELVSANRADVVTARWVGIAVPTDVDVPYSRVWHEDHGWIFEVTIDLLGVNAGVLAGDDVPESVTNYMSGFEPGSSTSGDDNGGSNSTDDSDEDLYRDWSPYE